jgi:hypothetical protein
VYCLLPQVDPLIKIIMSSQSAAVVIQRFYRKKFKHFSEQQPSSPFSLPSESPVVFASQSPAQVHMERIIMKDVSNSEFEERMMTMLTKLRKSDEAEQQQRARYAPTLQMKFKQCRSI